MIYVLIIVVRYKMKWLFGLFDGDDSDRIEELEKEVQELKNSNQNLLALNEKTLKLNDEANTRGDEYLADCKRLLEALENTNTISNDILQRSEKLTKAFKALFDNVQILSKKLHTTFEDISGLARIRDKMKSKRISLTQAENELNSLLQVITPDIEGVVSIFNDINNSELINAILDKKEKK